MKWQSKLSLPLFLMNWRKRNVRTSVMALWIIGITALVLVLVSVFSQGKDYSVITSDGVGYYSYLPNLFQTNSLSSQVPDNRFIVDIEGKGVNKYYVGTALSMSPFYALGKLFSSNDTSGFTLSYQIAISFSGIFYLILGLVFTQKLLRLFQFSETVIFITLLALFFGTNLMVYSVFQPSMSHIYSFCWIAGFVLSSKKYVQTVTAKYLYLSVACLAILILVRPINGIVVFLIPFIVGSGQGTKLYFFSLLSKYRLVWSLLVFLSIISIQPLMWYLQSGNWWVWSYGQEGFDFSSPNLFNFLFSFRKGVFVYTPILIFSLLGGVLWLKKNRFQGVGILMFFVGVVYLLSSWWNWYYGPSFGQRPLVDFYSISAILFAFATSQFLGSRQHYVAFILGVSFVFLNLIQTYQFQNGIISSWDMNWKKYQYSFLKVGRSYKNKLGGNNDIMLHRANTSSLSQVNYEFHSTENKALDYTNKEFAWEHLFHANSNFVTHRGIYIRVELDVLDSVVSNKNEALFVVDLQDSSGRGYHYYTFPIRDIPPVSKSWKKESYQIEVPKIKQSSDRLKLYIWNKGNESFLLDNIKIEVLGIN